MPRSRLSKVDILSRVYKLKTELYNGHHHDKNDDWHDGAHKALNDVLNIIDEFSN